MKTHARNRAVFCVAAVALAGVAAVRGYAQDANGSTRPDAAPCALDCLVARLVATAQEVDGGTVHASMGVPADALVDIAIVQAKGGRFQQAAGTVAQLAELPLSESTRNRHRARAYVALAEAHAAAGRFQQAAGTVAQLAELPLSESARNRHRARAYVALAEAHAAVGHGGDADRLFEQALAAASADEWGDEWIHAKIAKMLFRTQGTEEAQEVLSRIDRTVYRAPLIADMVMALAQSDGVDPMRQMLAGEFGAIAHDRTMAVFGLTAVHAAVTPDGSRKACWNYGRNTRVEAYSEITDALVALGEVDEALALASMIEADFERAATTAAIAVAQARTGESAAAQETFRDAVAIADSITHSYTRAQTLIAIVESDKRRGRDYTLDNRSVVGASLALRLKTMASAIAEPGSRGIALVAVVGALARAGESATALAAATEIDTACYRAEALVAIAAEQAAAGQIEDARATGRRIEEMPLPNPTRGCGNYDAALEAIAKAQAKAGRFDAALATLATIELAPFRLGALADIAVAVASHSTQH